MQLHEPLARHYARDPRAHRLAEGGAVLIGLALPDCGTEDLYDDPPVPAGTDVQEPEDAPAAPPAPLPDFLKNPVDFGALEGFAGDSGSSAANARVKAAFDEMVMRQRQVDGAAVYVQQREATFRAMVEASANDLTRSQRTNFFRFLTNWSKKPVQLPGSAEPTNLMSGETADEFVTKLLEMWGPSVETLKLPLGTDATTITGIVTLRDQIEAILSDKRYPPGTFVTLNGKGRPLESDGRAAPLAFSLAVSTACRR